MPVRLLRPSVTWWSSLGMIFFSLSSRARPFWIEWLYPTSVQSSELVANLFQDCSPSKIDYHGLCKCVEFRIVLSLSFIAELAISARQPVERMCSSLS